MKVLVTGGAGYIGSHACKALARAGFTPVSYDNLSRGHREAVRWGPLETGDIADGARLRQVIRAHGCRAALHFAAFAYVGESVQAPRLYYANNIAGSQSLCDALLAEQVDALVFSSSCSVYGDSTVQPMHEGLPFAPVSPYAFSKYAIERLLADYRRAYGLRSISLRYFNAAGADPDGDLGEDHDPETHLIPLVLQTAAGRRARIDIYGNDYPTVDGTCIRDYIHVADLAEAHVAALRRLLAGEAPAALNLGTGQGHSVMQVIEACRRVTGRPIAVTIKPRREGDPAMAVADPRRAFAELGWKPRHADLSESITHAWAWMQRARDHGRDRPPARAGSV